MIVQWLKLMQSSSPPFIYEWTRLIFFFSLCGGSSLYAFDWKPDYCGSEEGFKIDQTHPSYGHSSLGQTRQMNQANTFTCYFHASKLLLEHFHKSNPSDPQSDFAFQSFVEACPIAQPYAVLHRMRRLKKSIYLYQGKQSENQILECSLTERQENDPFIEISKQAAQTFEVVDTVEEDSSNSVNFNYDYNIHVKNINGLNALKVEEEIDQIFSSTRMPIILTLDRHAVSLTGSSMVCCKNECKKRILVRNSWGNAGSGWYSADRFTRTHSDSKVDLIFLRKCDSTSENIHNIEKCDSDIIHGDQPLVYLATANDVPAILKYIKKKRGIDNLKKDEVVSAVNNAIYHSNTETLEVLAKLGADLNQTDDLGFSPVHAAAFMGFIGSLKALAKYKINLNLGRPTNGTTPAILAAQEGHTEALKFLAEHGADLNKAENQGITPAYSAAVHGHTEALKFLAEHGANLYQTDFLGTSLAHAAAISGKVDILKFLTKHKMDLNMGRSTDGITPAYFAAQGGQADALEFLAEHGADLNRAMNLGATPTLIAAHFGYIDVLKILAKYKADLNKAANDGRTPAYAAAANGQVDALKFLAEHGADLNQRNQEGNTPSHVAAKEACLSETA